MTRLSFSNSNIKLILLFFFFCISLLFLCLKVNLFIECIDEKILRFLGFLTLLGVGITYKISDCFNVSFMFAFILWSYHVPTFIIAVSYFDYLPYGAKLFFWNLGGFFAICCFFAFLLGVLIRKNIKNSYNKRQIFIKQNDFQYLCFAVGCVFALCFFKTCVCQGSYAYLDLLKSLTEFTWYFNFATLLFAFSYTCDKKIIKHSSFMLVMSMATWLMVYGLRGPALYPLVVFSVSFIMRSPEYKYKLIVFALVTLLVLIPISRIMRNGSFHEFSALEGIVEMGRSIGNMAKTLEQLSDKKIEHQYGGTYFYPLWRQLCTLLGEDYRFLFGIEYVGIRQHPMSYSSVTVSGGGGSVIGESYYNYKYFGIVLFLMLGFVVEEINQLKYTRNGLIIALSVLGPLLEGIRGYFYYIPILIILRILLLLFLAILSDQMERRNISLFN